MKYIATACVAVLLWIAPSSAQTPLGVTGSDIPDDAAWRIWLNQKGEVPGNHSEAFTTYVASLGLSTDDAAVLQTVLESFAMKETALRTASNAKIEAADENLDATSASSLQTAFQAQLAALVSSTTTRLGSKLSANGAAFLTLFIQQEKKHMSISPLDVTLARTRPLVRLQPAAYHVHGGPQGTRMGFGYSTYASSWISVAGTNGSGEPYGTFYRQIGAQGTTSPCTGSCLSALHSVTTSYNHAGGGSQSFTVARQSPNTAMNGSYTYSWPFDATTNFFWGNETAWVSLDCTIAGIFLGNNPAAPGKDPFQSEVATTYTTTRGQVAQRCAIQGGCYVQLLASQGNLPTYCSTVYPDYVPTILAFNAFYNATFLEFQQNSTCERGTTGDPWTCDQNTGHNNPNYNNYHLEPPTGGAHCTSHHP